MIIQWGTFSMLLTPSDLGMQCNLLSPLSYTMLPGIIKQLAAAQQNTNLTPPQVDAIIVSMITIVSHANMPEHVDKFNQLRSQAVS